MAAQAAEPAAAFPSTPPASPPHCPAVDTALPFGPGRGDTALPFPSPNQGGATQPEDSGKRFGPLAPAFSKEAMPAGSLCREAFHTPVRAEQGDWVVVNSSGKKDFQNRRRWLTRRFNAGRDLLQQELYLPILENGCPDHAPCT